MQVFVDEPMNLLNTNGNLNLPGYSTRLIYNYNREAIKVSSLRIKEWDYYYVGNEHFAIALTIADNGYMGLMSASLLDFDTKFQKTQSIMTFFPMGKTNLPHSSVIGDTIFQNKRVAMTFKNDGKVRTIHCLYRNFHEKQDLVVDITLSNEPEESMVIATPFEKSHHFYYNQKINGMDALGYAKLGNKEYLFSDGSFGTLDWGRGVWTYKNTWYWSSLSTLFNGEKLGFNFGFGFGDTSQASENCLFYKGKLHKLDHIEFHIPKKDGKEDYLSPWTFTSNDGRVTLTFEPILNRSAFTNLGILSSNQNQVFGYFSGFVRLDDGTKISIDKKLGFAEKVINKW